MISRVILCTLIALAPAVVQAQDITNQELLNQIKLLQEDVKSVKDLAERVSLNEQSIGQLKESLDELTTIMNNQDEELRQIVEAISTTDTDGQYVPDILSNMDKSPQFKQDVSNAVHRSLQTEGTFTINNKTNSFQRIYVNRREYGVNAGQVLTLNKIPVGTVTTQLPGQKLENWTVGAPNYDEKIDIVPTSTPLTTVYRPVTSVYSPPVTSVYSPPAYYLNSPTYYYRPLYYYRPWYW